MAEAVGQQHYTGADAARFMEQQGGMFGGEMVSVSEKLTIAAGTGKTTKVYTNPEVAGRLGVQAEAKTVSGASVQQEAARAAQVASSSSVRDAIASSRAAVRGVGAAQAAPTPTPKASGVERKGNGIG